MNPAIPPATGMLTGAIIGLCIDYKTGNIQKASTYIGHLPPATFIGMMTGCALGAFFLLAVIFCNRREQLNHANDVVDMPQP